LLQCCFHFIYTIGVNIQASAKALNTRITKPTRAACIASPVERSEAWAQTAGIWAKGICRGKPDDARMKEPIAKRVSIVPMVWVNVFMASVGATKIDCIPVSGSMDIAVKKELIAA